LLRTQSTVRDRLFDQNNTSRLKYLAAQAKALEKEAIAL